MSEKLPIWKEKYEKMGVTPEELYMRQNGLCWLRPEIINEDIIIYCTDGKYKAKTSSMLNPTIECVQCISKFTQKAIKDALLGKKPEIREEPSNNDN